VSKNIQHGWRHSDSEHALLQRIRHERKHLLVLVEQEHNSEVSEALVREARARNQLQAFDLPEVGGVAEHVDVEQFRNVVVPLRGVFLAKRRPDGSRLLLNERALVGYRLDAELASVRAAERASLGRRALHARIALIKAMCA
jgi:hypothetical protein